VPASGRTRVKPGKLLASRYRLIEPVGEGGSGVVWKAVDIKTNRLVAVKLPKNSWQTLGGPDRMVNEARQGSQLDHRSIVPIIAMERFEDSYFLVSEFIDGKPLSEWLRNERVGVDTATKAVRVIAEALLHAHSRGVIHRDVKPGNVLVDHHGRVFLIDFGASLPARAAALGEGGGTGTPAYMAPEQFSDRSSGRVQLDVRCDIYSLGVVFYQLLTGHRPFHGETVAEARARCRKNVPDPPSARNPDVPRALDKIVLKCLAPKPSRRFASAECLITALDRYLSDVDRTWQPETAGSRSRSLSLGWRRACRAGWRSLAAAVALLTVGLVGHLTIDVVSATTQTVVVVLGVIALCVGMAVTAARHTRAAMFLIMVVVLATAVGTRAIAVLEETRSNFTHVFPPGPSG
jgi:serine/threonine-protein kinase